MERNIIFNNVTKIGKTMNFYYLITLTQSHKQFRMIELMNLLPKNAIIIKSPGDFDPFVIVRTDNIENVRQTVFVKSLDILLFLETEVNFSSEGNHQNIAVSNEMDSKNSKNIEITKKLNYNELTNRNSNYEKKFEKSNDIKIIYPGSVNIPATISESYIENSIFGLYEYFANLNISKNTESQLNSTKEQPSDKYEEPDLFSETKTGFKRPLECRESICDSRPVEFTKLGLYEIIKTSSFVSQVNELLCFFHKDPHSLTYSGKISTFQNKYLERQKFFESLSPIIFGQTNLKNSKILYKLVVTPNYNCLVIDPYNDTPSFRKSILKMRIPERLFIGRTCMEPVISTFMFNMVRFSPEKTMEQWIKDQDSSERDVKHPKCPDLHDSRSNIKTHGPFESESSHFYPFVGNESEDHNPDSIHKWPSNEMALKFASKKSEYSRRNKGSDSSLKKEDENSKSISIILDPFCGSGGLLLIPSLLDYYILGSDIKRDEMVGKCEYNSEDLLDEKQKLLVQQFINTKRKIYENMNHNYSKLYKIEEKNTFSEAIDRYSSESQVRNIASQSIKDLSNKHKEIFRSPTLLSSEMRTDDSSGQEIQKIKKTEYAVKNKILLSNKDRNQNMVDNKEVKQPLKDDRLLNAHEIKTTDKNHFINSLNSMNDTPQILKKNKCIHVKEENRFRPSPSFSNHQLIEIENEDRGSDDSHNFINFDNGVHKFKKIVNGTRHGILNTLKTSEIFPMPLKIPIPLPLFFIQNLPGTRTTLHNTSILSNFYQYNCVKNLFGFYENDIEGMGEILKKLERNRSEKYIIEENTGFPMKNTFRYINSINLSIITDMPYGIRIPLRTETLLLKHLYNLAKKLLKSTERLCFCIKNGRDQEILQLFRDFILISKITQKVHSYEREFFCFQKI